MNDKQQLAAMGEHLAEQAEQATQPMCMTKRIEELERKYKAAISKANAWDSLYGWVNDGTNNPQMELKEHVSRELFNDGCQSAWIHLSRFIEALFEKISDLEDEVGVERKESTTDHTEQSLAVVPEGWQLEALDNDDIVVRKDGFGFYVASFNTENIASTILHALASDMLSAAPKPEAK